MRTIVGLAMILLGAWLVVVVVSLAGMVDPALGAGAWLAELLGGTSGLNGPGLVAGLGLIGSGLVVMAGGKPGRSGQP